jgi:hypothetical protein
MFLWSWGRPVSEARNFMAILSRMSRKFVILPQHLTNLQASTDWYEDRFKFMYVDICTSQETQTSIVCYRDRFTFVYIDNAHTSQETQASTACFVDSFTFIYVDDVHTSQETHLWVPMACYGDSFLLYLLVSILLPICNSDWHHPVSLFSVYIIKCFGLTAHDQGYKLCAYVCSYSGFLPWVTLRYQHEK